MKTKRFQRLIILIMTTVFVCQSFLFNNPMAANAAKSEKTLNFIQVQGTSMYDEITGEQFQMIGINIDNNLWGRGLAPGQHCMKLNDYREIRALGFNTIRLMISYEMTQQKDFYPWLDEIISWVNEVGLYAVIDMHTSQGGRQLVAKEEAAVFWNNVEQQEEFIQQWIEIASRYAEEACIINYDLLNEPIVIVNGNQSEAESVYIDFMQRLIAEIRKVDQKHIMCVEVPTFFLGNYPSGGWGKAMDLKKLCSLDNNMVIDQHTYGPAAFAFQTTDKVIKYDDFESIQDEKWITNFGRTGNSFLASDEWNTLGTYVFQADHEDVNTGVVKFEFNKLTNDMVLLIDDIIVEEYDKDQNYLGQIYQCDFSSDDYEWKLNGTGTLSIDETGVTPCLKISNLDPNKNYTIYQAASSTKGAFTITPGNYYQISLKLKSNTSNTTGGLRVSMAAYHINYRGGMRGFLEYNFQSEYANEMSRIGVPIICNETGCNYEAMKNGGDQWLYDSVKYMNENNVNYCLFAFAGWEFGLLYPSNQTFGTQESYVRQNSYDATYKAIKQEKVYEHVFKDMETMIKFYDCEIGDQVLVLGNMYAGDTNKRVFTITGIQTSDSIYLKNGLYAAYNFTIE